MRSIRPLLLCLLTAALTLTGCGTVPGPSGAESSSAAVSGSVTSAPETSTPATGTEIPAQTDAQGGTVMSSVTEASGTVQPENTDTQTAVATETTAAIAPALMGRLTAMTLREKAAQMILAGCSDEWTADYVVQQGAGGLCLFAAPFAGKTQWSARQMTERFQQEATTPLLIAVDEEGGTVNRVSLNPNLRGAPFFSPRYLMSIGGKELLLSDTREKARLLLSIGVNVNLAPVCDVPLDDSNYIAPRTFSLDANEAAECAGMVVSTMKQNGLGSCLKHFPGYGGSSDTHLNMAYDDRDYSAFTSRDFLPFASGIAAGADAVMVSHNIVSCMDAGYPASLSPAVHRILREELGFTGVIISDDLGMNAITQFTNGQNPAVAAVIAGNDLICYAEFDNSVNAIVNAVQSGLIPETRLNESVLRILAWKHSLGLLH